jgi:hypothetical protein
MYLHPFLSLVLIIISSSPANLPDHPNEKHIHRKFEWHIADLTKTQLHNFENSLEADFKAKDRQLFTPTFTHVVSGSDK